jgi:hypothetical protein
MGGRHNGEEMGGEREGETAARLASSNQREAERLGVANRRGGPAGARAGSAARGGRGETRGWAPRVSERGREGGGGRAAGPWWAELAGLD